jgi:hypothetical protein
LSGNAIIQQQPQQPIATVQQISIPVIQPQPIVDSSIVRAVQNRQKFVAIPTQSTTVKPTTIKPITTTEPETEEELENQAKSAFYKFGTSVHDTINDSTNVRQEERDGLELTGMYSYSDGFFKRTVYYKAGVGGYQVTKEEIQPIGDGPKFNPKGQAEVKSTLSGDYSINIEDFKLNRKQEDEIEKQIK